MSEFFWRTVNTILTVAFLYWVAMKFDLPGKIKSGIEGVVKRIEDAKSEKERALELLKEAEKKSKEAKKEAEEVLKRAEEIAEKQKEQMKKETADMVKRILDSAGEEIEKEVAAAKRELQVFAATKAVELARERLKGKVSPDFNEKLIRENLSKISKEGTL